MSAPRIPFQNIEKNRSTTASQKSTENLKVSKNLKRKLPISTNKKGSVMDSLNSSKYGGSENEGLDRKTNPIKAPPLSSSKTQLNIYKSPIVPCKKIKSFTVYKDIPLKTEETTLKELPEPRIRKRGYAKYRNGLSLSEDEYQDNLNLFLDNDTPIRRLPYDCLIKIFGLCQHTETLLALSRVCRSWRNVVLQPILWRSISCNWTSFNRELHNMSRLIRLNKQFKFVQKLSITAQCSTPLSHSMYIRNTSPFKQLDTLHLSNVRMCDIDYITSWMTHIKSLICTNIPVDKSGSVYIPNLTQLYQLKTLHLQFAKHCSLKLTYFISTPELERLPTTLTELKITDIKDKEENELKHQDIIDAAAFLTLRKKSWDNALSPEQILDTWIRLEQQLVLKYTMLTYLNNLTSLSLHSISSFTSRVWRECLIPCCSKLSHVSLSGWSGKRESPQAIIHRIYAYRQRRQSNLKISDVDLALSEFFALLTKVKFITLNDFVCTDGVVMGIMALNKSYDIQDWPGASIDQFLDSTLDDFNIIVKTKQVD